MHIAAVLNDVRSIHNVGAIFRTADAAGVEKIYLCGITPGPSDRFGNVRADFAKVALGAERSVSWTKVPDAADAIAALKTDGYEILAVEQSERSVPYFDARFPRHAKVALVLGNEVSGLPRAVVGAADRVIEIPMLGAKESLNVGIAFGIVVFGIRYGAVARSPRG